MAWHWSVLGLAWLALGAGAIADLGNRPSERELPPFPVALRYRVLATDAEPLLGFLAQRLAPSDDFRVGDRACRTSLLESRTEHLWFDDDAMSLLPTGSEVRLRRTAAVQGRERSDRVEAIHGGVSLRIESGIDATAPTRLEGSLLLQDLFLPASRTEHERSLRELGFDPSALRLALSVERRAHGIAIADNDGERLSISVVRVISRQEDLALQWHELEAVVPETTNDDRAAFLELRETILAELTAACPRLVRDEAEDYPRAFERLQRATWLPLRFLHTLHMSDLEAKITALLALSTICAAASATIAIRRLRRSRQAAELSPR